MVVVKRGGTPILLEHGAGQTYRGHDGYRHPSNPGGDLRERIGLFLCTNEATARANRDRYPSIPAVVVGSPRLDVLRDLRAIARNDGPADAPVLGMTWHWNCLVCPESRWAFPEWGEAMRHLDWPGEIVGSAHPRAWRNAERWYQRLGIRGEPSWTEMVQQVDVLSCDNSSVMFEAAALGIPVVVVNSARYRQEVEHGLRFWTYADIGPNVWPFDYDSNEEMGAAWSDSCKRAEGYADRMALRIADMAATVYPYQGEAAQRAADAVVGFCS
jgi:hypothetical protein